MIYVTLVLIDDQKLLHYEYLQIKDYIQHFVD